MKTLKKEIDFLEEFRRYLNREFTNKAVKQDHVSRCRRVNTAEGSLLEHYQTDKGLALLDRLTYTREDMYLEKKPLHHVEFKGEKGYESIYEGTQVLLKSIKIYFEFLCKRI